MNAVMLPTRTLFIADTYVNVDPTAGQVAEIARVAAEEIRRFGITPKVAGCCRTSSFGGTRHPQATKMQEALALVSAADPALEVEGEMHGDAALDEEVRLRVFPNSRLKGEANLLVMPTVDAANIAFDLLKASVGGGVTLGPMYARRREARAHPDALGDRAPHGRHDRADGGRCERRAQGPADLTPWSPDTAIARYPTFTGN